MQTLELVGIITTSTLIAIGAMALEAEVKKQLLDAREKIIAQLNETQFPTTPGGTAYGGRGPVYDYAYVELQQELHEIDKLLESEEDDQDCAASDEATTSYSALPIFLHLGRQPKRSKVFAAAALISLLLWVVFVFLRALLTS